MNIEAVLKLMISTSRISILNIYNTFLKSFSYTIFYIFSGFSDEGQKNSIHNIDRNLRI